MEFRVLGPLEVLEGDRVVCLGGRKQRAVLASLLLHPNEVVSADALVEAVWGEQPPEKARATLQVYIANLRRLLEPPARVGDTTHRRLVRRPPGYVLRVHDDELDADRFNQLAQAGRAALSRGDARRAAGLLKQALDLCRGPVFPDLVCAALPPPEVASYEEQRLSVLEDRLDADLAMGRAGDLVAELETLVAVYPLRERLHGQLVLALYRSERQADALEAYRAARAVLLEELGIEPGPALQRLELAVLQQDPALDRPPLQTGARPTLPAPPSAMIGRKHELAAVTALVRDNDVRLVTLLGPGGTGKTRLVLGVAAALQQHFPGGAFFVPLAPLAEAQLVLPTIAAALGVKETADRPLMDVVSENLDADDALLVLDNFEHVLAAAAQVAELLTASPKVTVVVTSRSALRISGEHEYDVSPLPPPSEDPLPPLAILRENESVRLFTDRARAVVRDFEVGPENAAAVAAICRRLDGLPLAIELAAARVRVLPPEAILARLDARLRLLTGGPRHLPARQQTLRGTLEWSYELLEPAERELFAQLAVFRGGCTFEAVEEVCAVDGEDFLDLLDRVEHVVSQSLLRRVPMPSGKMRFTMLETIWEYASELLDVRADAARLRRRHAEYYLALAESAEAHLNGPEQLDWISRLNTEHDNLRAALSWSTHNAESTDMALRLAAALWHFWEMSGALTEGRRWFDVVLGVAGAGSPDVRLRAASGAGTLAWAQGDYERAALLHQKALALSREIGDQRAEAFALNALGVQRLDREAYDEAEALCQQAKQLALAVGEPRTAGIALHNLAEIALHRADYAGAAQIYDEALQIFGELGDQWLLTASMHGLAVTALRQGDNQRAGVTLRDSLALAAQMGDNFWIAESLEGLAAVGQQAGEPATATRLLAAADALRRRIGAPLQPAEQPDVDSLVTILRATMPEGEFDHAWEDGRRLTMQEAIEEATLCHGLKELMSGH